MKILDEFELGGRAVQRIGGADLCDLLDISPATLTDLKKRGIAVHLAHDSYDLRATVYTRQGSVVAPVAEGEEGTAESGATYTFENYEDEVEMSELSMTFIGGIDYTSEFWGVGVYFTLDLYTDTSFSGAVAVRDESFDLSAERTHPIGVAASAWYSPFADYLVAASASTGAETAIRVAFGKFF